MMSWFNSRDYQSRLDTTPAATQAFRAGAADPLFAARPQFSGNCVPEKPARVRRSGNRLIWSAVPNATSYEVWRNGRRVATTSVTRYAASRGRYKVRGLNPLGAGPFASTH